MEVPASSVFSAVSELLVTAVVVYAIVRNMRGGELPWRMLGVVLVFELCVNIVYMANRAAAADASHDLGAGLKALYAAHGILSLLMFVGLVVVYLLAIVDHKLGRPTWFRRHRAMAWAFLVLWLISIASGEAIFLMRYGPALMSRLSA